MSQSLTEKNDVCELVRKMESDYNSGETLISKYVSLSQKDTLDRIDAYLNSKHTSGDTDSQDREKPFFNIVTAAVNVWYRATDLDRKNIKGKTDKSELQTISFLAGVHLQNWMKGKGSQNNFGQFLNKWGRILAKYGSAVSKFVEQDGELKAVVVPWSRLITDTIDFDNNPVVELLQFTEAQLYKHKEYDKEIVEKLCDALVARETADKQKQDNRTKYIKLYEVHGELPLSYLTGKETDEDEYVQQMHVISFVESKEEGEFDDFTLYSGREKQSPYQKDDLIEEDDRVLSIGAVQNLFDAQWMVNHSVKQIKDQLDLASQIIYQTSDGNFVGQNALSAIQTGDILIHAPNAPITTLGTPNALITAPQQSMMTMWQSLGSQINGISEAMLGKNAPSGSAWRQTEALLQESHSLFEVMTENKGLALEQMLRKFIVPFLKKKMDTSDEISATLESYQITKIDSMYVPNEAIRRYNAKATEDVLNGVLPQEQQVGIAQEQDQLRTGLQQQGDVRFFKPSDISTKTWKEALKDFQWEFEYNITSEAKDTQLVMETLNTALKTFASATPEQLADPNFKLVFNKILEQTSVISPIEIQSIPPTPPQPPPDKVSQSISYKDLQPDGQVQLAAKAGIKIAPPPPPEPKTDKTKVAVK